MTLAYIFPGQGSQSQGMLAELVQSYPFMLDDFSSVSDVIGYDVWKLIQEGPESELNQTAKTQVAMLTSDVAIFRLLRHLGWPQSPWMAGHSLGEYAALVNAEAISLPNAAKLVGKRGELMQKTVPLGLGAMAAIIGLGDKEVEDICLRASTDKEQAMAANFNAIGQVVIAGHSGAVNRAIQIAEEEGAKMAKIIPVSVPCHCQLLSDAAEAFEEYLYMAEFKDPNTAVVSNVDLSIYTSVPQIRFLLKQQLVKPVRWVQTIQFLQSRGVSQMIESGPGKVLTGLVKRIDKSISVSCVQDKSSLDQLGVVKHE